MSPLTPRPTTHPRAQAFPDSLGQFSPDHFLSLQLPTGRPTAQEPKLFPRVYVK